MRFRELSRLMVSVFVALATHSVEAAHFRIVAGREATTEEFPYQVSLEVQGRQWCGGSIISKNFILTASHCVKWAENRTDISTKLMAVRVGNDVSLIGGTVYQIAKVIVHEKYIDKADVDTFDIALVKTVKPFEYNDRVKPIQLATVAPKEGEMAWVTGFGKQEVMRSSNAAGRHLMAVELPIVSLESCRKILDGVADDMICAGHKKGHRDSCGGDSGGPLAVNNELAGVVAWGVGCGREGFPGVYTNVAFYIKWVKEKMALEEKTSRR